MDIQIQSVKFNADQKLLDFINNKLSKIERVAERSTGAEVILKLDKDEEKGNKVVTISLHMPGDDLVAEFKSHTFEESVDCAIEAIKKQLERVKDKHSK